MDNLKKENGMTIQDLVPKVIKWRRDLHQIPELGNELPQTVQYVRTVLDELGIAYQTLMNGNAIVAVINGAGSGKCIGLRADMDGLPIAEQTGLAFASQNGNMHACGHDGHTAMLLGAATFLNANKHSFKGAIKLLFQPGEEMPGGAEPMIKEGALENPKVDAVFGLHNGNLSSDIPSGHMAFKHGAMMAAPDRLLITVNGKGAHGAYPDQSKDPIVIASEIILALQRLVSREKKSTEPAVLSVCRIEGGFNHNIIPSIVTFEGTIRTTSPELRDYYKLRVQKICDSFAAMHDISIDVQHDYVYPALINDNAMTDLAVEVARSQFGDDAVHILKEPVMGGEDMAYFINAVPGTFMFLINPAAIDGLCYPHHHPKFDIDENYFERGITMLVEVARSYLAQK